MNRCRSDRHGPTAAVPPRAETTCALFVTYHPGDAFGAHLAAVARQVESVHVIDNSATPEARARLECWRGGLGNVEVAYNAENVGQAAALNQGAERAIDGGCRWLLTFDQDTTPFSDLLDTLAHVYHEHPRPHRLGVIGANFLDRWGAARVVVRSRKVASVRRDAVVTSGSLLSLAAYRDAGPFRNDFFIDSVDREYCYRLRSAGYDVVMSTKPAMNHAWGEPTTARFGPLEFATSNHSPLRRYYIARNLLRTVAAHRARPGTCAVAALAASVDLCRALAFERRRFAKAAATFVGLVHGVLGRMGPARLPAALE